LKCIGSHVLKCSGKNAQDVLFNRIACIIKVCFSDSGASTQNHGSFLFENILQYVHLPFLGVLYELKLRS